MTLYRITHRNSYRYQQAVVHSQHRLHLTPHRSFGQQLRSHDIHVDNTAAQLYQGYDSFGNYEYYIEISAPYEELCITAVSEILVKREAPNISLDTLSWDTSLEVSPDLLQYRWNSPHIRRSELLRSYALESFPAGISLSQGLYDFTRRIFDECVYDPVATDIATPVEEVLKTKRGVCQDFAHLAIAGLRSLGLAACYVSGYLETAPPAGKKRLRGADASHAWLAVWHPQLGWLQADPTNGCMVADRHIVSAIGRDFSDVSPITGIIFGGGAQQLEVGVDVIPESEWSQISV